MAVGQFHDALETKALEQALVRDPREGKAFIDDPLLQWSDDEEDDDDIRSSPDEDSGEETEYEASRLADVDDEDWEIAEKGESWS